MRVIFIDKHMLSRLFVGGEKVPLFHHRSSQCTSFTETAWRETWHAQRRRHKPHQPGQDVWPLMPVLILGSTVTLRPPSVQLITCKLSHTT